MFHYLISSDVIKNGQWALIYGFLHPHFGFKKKSFSEEKECDRKLDEGIGYVKNGYYFKNYKGDKQGLVNECRTFIRKEAFRFLDVADIALAAQFYVFYQTIPLAERKLREQAVDKAVCHYVRDSELRKELAKHTKTWLFLLPKSSIAEYVSMIVGDLFGWVIAVDNEDPSSLSDLTAYENLFGAAAFEPARREFENRQDSILVSLESIGYVETKMTMGAVSYFVTIGSVKGWDVPEPDYLNDWAKLSQGDQKVLNLLEYVNAKCQNDQNQQLHILFRVANMAMDSLLKSDEQDWDGIWEQWYNHYLATEAKNTQKKLINVIFYLRLQLFYGWDIFDTCQHLVSFENTNSAEFNRLSHEMVIQFEGGEDEQNGAFERQLADAAVLHHLQKKKEEAEKKKEEEKRQAVLVDLWGETKTSKSKSKKQKKRRGKSRKNKRKQPKQQPETKKNPAALLDLLNVKLAIPTLEDDMGYRLHELVPIKNRLDKAISSLAGGELKEAQDCLSDITMIHQSLFDMLHVLQNNPTHCDSAASREMILAADNKIKEARARLHRFIKGKDSVAAFHKDLMEKLAQETLDTARSDGGRMIPHHLDFDSIEDLYHGCIYSTPDPVTIDGKERPLTRNEALVLYVTKSSRTENVLFCISVGLWRKRTPEDPRPSVNSRRSYVGDPTKNKKIDPEVWIHTDKTLLILHIERSEPE